MRFEGRCHCGNVEVGFETAQPPEAVPLRACGCSFCRLHGSTALTDPAGHLEIRLREPADVSRYRFALRTADFLVCRTCGVFVAAVCEVGGGLRATLNANVLDARASFTQVPVPMSYDGEDVSGRLARRARVWTPASLQEGGPVGPRPADVASGRRP
jgi:hypothetical protein